jgi:hypothetical protein
MRADCIKNTRRRRGKLMGGVVLLNEVSAALCDSWYKSKHRVEDGGDL